MSTYFNKESLIIEVHKDWLVEVTDTKVANCRVCPPPKNRFALSNMEERALVSHMKDKKYIQHIQDNVQDSSQPKLNSFPDKVTVSNEKSFSSMTSSSSKSSKSIMDFVYDKKMLQMRKSFRY